MGKSLWFPVKIFPNKPSIDTGAISWDFLGFERAIMEISRAYRGRLALND